MRRRSKVSRPSGVVDSLPCGVAALFACSDLQGLGMPGGNGQAPQLLGEVLAQDLSLLADLNEVPPAGQIGVLLLGDFYATPTPTERGQSGNVQSVWHAFAERFRWVVGVAGNHDVFADGLGQQADHTSGKQCLLDGNVITLDDLRIAGVSGIIGDPKKGRLWRRSEADFLWALGSVLKAGPDLLLLHQSPQLDQPNLLGHPAITPFLRTHPNLLTLCGHGHWPFPLVTLPIGGQILNVDARGVLLSTAE